MTSPDPIPPRLSEDERFPRGVPIEGEPKKTPLQELRAYLEAQGEPVSLHDVRAQVLYKEKYAPEDEQGSGKIGKNLEEGLLDGAYETQAGGNRKLVGQEVGRIAERFVDVRRDMKRDLSVFFEPSKNLSPCAEPLQRVWRDNFLPILAEEAVRKSLGAPITGFREASMTHAKESVLSIFSEELGYQIPPEMEKAWQRSFKGIYEMDKVKKLVIFIDNWKNTQKLIENLQGLGRDLPEYLRDLLWAFQMVREVGSNEAVQMMAPELKVEELDEFLAGQGFELEDGVYREKRTMGKRKGDDSVQKQFIAGSLMRKIAEPVVLNLVRVEAEQQKYQDRKKLEAFKEDFKGLDAIGLKYEAEFKKSEALQAELKEVEAKLVEKKWGVLKKYSGQERERLLQQKEELEKNIEASKKELEGYIKEAEAYQHVLGREDKFAEVAGYWSAFKALLTEKNK